METESIKAASNDLDFPFNSNAKSFFTAAANCIDNNQHHRCNDTIVTGSQASDIEMLAFQSVAYTSLKDLLPSTPPSSTISPTYSLIDSWREIPIKDPLVQHAAWAYLQPMAEPRDSENPSLMDKCCGVFGCFQDVVLVIVKSWLEDGREKGRTERNEKDEEEEEKYNREEHTPHQNQTI